MVLSNREIYRSYILDQSKKSLVHQLFNKFKKLNFTCFRRNRKENKNKNKEEKRRGEASK